MGETERRAFAALVGRLSSTLLHHLLACTDLALPCATITGPPPQCSPPPRYTHRQELHPPFSRTLPHTGVALDVSDDDGHVASLWWSLPLPVQPHHHSMEQLGSGALLQRTWKARA